MRTQDTACIVVERDGKLLLVRRGNRTFHGYWCFPGGHAKTGETPGQAAQREASEEIGEVKVDEKPFLVFVHEWPGDRGDDDPHLHRCHAFKAKITRELRAASDAAELGWFTREDVRKLKLTNYTERILEKLEKPKGDEYLDAVDEGDNLIRKASRRECHSNPKLIHRSTAIIVFNSRGEMLLQKRSRNMDMYPGKWTYATAGHVTSGESYEQTAKRELKEEIGIDIPVRPLFRHLFSGEKEKEMIMVFEGRSDGPFRTDPEEVDEVRFFNTGEVRKLLGEKPDLFSPDCKEILERYFSDVRQ